jgi:GntR family transcriptional repressor for pyruvate dehydrogenase complex
MAIHREKTNLSDIFQFRRLIEPLIASLAAENALASEINDLERILHDHNLKINNVKAVMELDSSFHLALARASGNKIFLRIVEALNDIIAETREETLQFKERRIKSLEGHFAILKAIEEKEAKVARKAMDDHLKAVEKIIINKKSSPRKTKPERKRRGKSIK